MSENPYGSRPQITAKRSITNIYFIDVNYVPVSLLINTIIFIIMFIRGYDFVVNRKIIMLLLILMLSVGTTSLINGDIYYLYILTKNIVFLITLSYIYQNFDFKVFSKIAFIVILLNNLVISGILLNIQPFVAFSELFTSIFNINMRFDYRVSGISSGTLHASLLSCYAFIYNLYYVSNNKVKIPIAFLLLFFMFIQSRSAIILAMASLFLFVLQKFLKLKPQINFKKIIFNSGILFFCLLVIYHSLPTIDNYIPNFSSTIRWQLSGLTELSNSGSIEDLQMKNQIELEKFYQEADISEILFGNGKGNWRGEGSTQTDTGFVVQLIGLGIIGSLIVNFLFILLLVTILKSYRSKNFIVLICIFMIQLYMNYKSTSFIGFYYFNLFFIFYSIVLKNDNLSVETNKYSKNFIERQTLEIMNVRGK